MKSTIHFHGGAGMVTGSNFLLDTGNAKFLIDCGMFQGQHSAEDVNWKPFPYDPASISFLINTHAHIDHIGRIPKLVRDGFRGTILSTEATKAIAVSLLYDALQLAEEVARHVGGKIFYDKKDIMQAMLQWEVVPYRKTTELIDGFSVEFLNAGHILGSAMALFSRGTKSIVFSGDLGGGNSPLLSHAEVPAGANYLVIESVYGDRVRKDDINRLDHIENIIENTAMRGGTLLIPAFSTERTQDLLYEIRSLMLEKRIPSMPVYLDSPLAEKITQAYLEYPQYFSKDMQKRVEAGEHIFDFPELRYVHDVEESRKIIQTKGEKIIIAGSGMSNGGRVLAHEKEILSDKASTLLIVGYQSAGSLGRRIAEGAKKVQIMHEYVMVRCRVETMYGYSAHMDSEQLLEFVNIQSSTLKEVFVVMGEPASSMFLAQRIRDYLGVKATVPEQGSTAEIEV